jgi:hypothetical protein
MPAHLAGCLAMRLKINPRVKTLALVTIIALAIMPLFLAQGSSLQLTSTTEYTNYVHTYNSTDTEGGYTRIDKPMFPVLINNNIIPIDQDWTVICPLEANHNYHVYCYGAWVNTSAAAKTDYDIYVYNPQGQLESSHTEAAGFPEHLGTTTNDALFTPKQSGNYSFVIKNDPRESEGAQQATFMIMETLACDEWHSLHVEGKNGDSLPSFHTCWAYEFVTNESTVELYVKVPGTLDMYEARLYLMNDAKSLSINSYPLPWEPGLYGNVSGRIGGYNFENEGYRGVAYASCEYMGQAMSLTYTATKNGAKLYQVAFIGEDGSGDIEFLLKTRFESATLLPLVSPRRVYPDNATEISYIANQTTTLERAQLSYTTDDWNSTAALDMAIGSQTCNATIPGQKAGSLVQYRIDANDVLKNNMTVTGNYTVKQQPTLNITSVKTPILLGENVTVTGTLIPNENNSIVKVQIYNANSTQTADCPVSDNGTFTASFKPDASGLWGVSATSPETQTSWRVDSEELAVTVTEPPFYVKYSMFIIIGLIAVLAAGGAVYYLKFRES